MKKIKSVKPHSIAVLLPGYLDSKDYPHMIMIDKALTNLGYLVTRIDPYGLWENKKDVKKYTVTNYLKEVRNEIIKLNKEVKKPKDVLLVGHSLGAMVAIIAGSKFDEVKTVISLCPPPDLKKLAEKGKWKEKGYRTSTRDLPNNPDKTRTFTVPYNFIKDGLKYSTVQSAETLNKPLMIFIAEKDESIPTSETMKIVKVANNPHVVKENMGHDFRYSEDETSLVVKQIIDFLEMFIL